MEFFDKLGEKATQAYKVTAEQTGKLAKETKLKFKIGELRSQVNDIYKEIGKKVYEKHIREQEIDIQKEIEEQCTKIDVLSDEIESMLEECLILRDKKQCSNCNTQIEKEDKFCPKCGKKQDEKPAQEVEVLEKLENTSVEPEKQEEKEAVEERLQEKIEENNQQNENEEQYYQEEETENLEKTVEIESAIGTTQEDEEIEQ